MRLAKNSRAGSWEERKRRKRRGEKEKEVGEGRTKEAADRWGGSDLVAARSERAKREKREERGIEWS